MKQHIKNTWMRWAICLLVSLNGLSYGINRFVLVPIQDQLISLYDITAVEYNLLMSLYAWPNIVFAIVCGILIDKFGVRSMLSLSWLITVVGLSLILYSALERQYLLLAIGRVVVGIGNEGLSLTLKLYLIEFFHPKDYGIAFAIYLVFVTAGGIGNAVVGFQIYKLFGIEYSLAFPLLVAPFVAAPLFSVMLIEHHKCKDVTDVAQDEGTRLVDDTTHGSDGTQVSKLSDVRQFSYHFWVILAGFVLFAGVSMSGVNIRVSFLHHMFGVSYETATFIGIYGNVLAMLGNLFAGFFTARFGRRVELLVAAALCATIGNCIYGWLNGHIAWAFIAATLEKPSSMVYPVAYTAIPLLVGRHAQGTAFGIATATNFGTIAVCLLVVGLLTEDDAKYVHVQAFLVCLGVVVTMIFVLLRHLDVKCNDGLLRKGNDKGSNRTKSFAQDADVSMQKVTM